jgi:GNAT superfamily N-acetyltransferase
LEEELDIIIREAIQDDLPLIYNSWLKQYRESPFSVGVVNSVYYSQHRKIIDCLIERSVLRVACDAASPTKIYGWVCGEIYDPLVLHFIYVKKKYRKRGIGGMLLNEFGWKEVPHIITTHFMKYKRKKSKEENNIIYNPYLLYIYMKEGKRNEA